MTGYTLWHKIIKNLLRPVLLFLGLGSVKMTESLVAWRVTKEVSAKVNSYRKGRLCLGGRLKNVVAQFNGTGKWPWCLVNQVTAIIHFVARGSISPRKRPAAAGLFVLFRRWSGKHDPIYLSATFVPLPRDGKGQAGADGQDHYRGPRSTLRKEGGGRSWARSDTSNICGVEQINRTSENKHQNL